TGGKREKAGAKISRTHRRLGHAKIENGKNRAGSESGLAPLIPHPLKLGGGALRPIEISRSVQNLKVIGARGGVRSPRPRPLPDKSAVGITVKILIDQNGRGDIRRSERQRGNGET